MVILKMDESNGVVAIPRDGHRVLAHDDEGITRPYDCHCDVSSIKCN